MPLDNGDKLLIGIGDDEHQEITYFSHEGCDFDGGGHGSLLGKTFEEFFDRWMQLAFAGPEYWVIKQFHNEEGLQIDGEIGKCFKSWFFE